MNVSPPDRVRDGRHLLPQEVYDLQREKNALDSQIVRIMSFFVLGDESDVDRMADDGGIPC